MEEAGRHPVHTYRAICSWAGSTAAGYDRYDRTHRVEVPPARAVLDLSSDATFLGRPDLLNPEQLVVAAAASCQLLSFLAVAARARIDIVAYADEAEGVMAEDVRPMRITEIKLRPHITVKGPIELDRVVRLAELAHRECFIANSLVTNVSVSPTVEVAATESGAAAPGSARATLATNVEPRHARGRVEIRSIRPHEHSAAGELVVTAYRALPGEHLTGDYAAELADVARRSREAEVLVAVEQDAGTEDSGSDGTILLGCVTFVPDASSAWAELLETGESGMRMLAVVPDAQGCGLGRALVEACIARTVELGHRALMLHTTPWMTAAQHLYESLGFERFAERDWKPIPEVPLLAYRLELR